MPAAYALTAAGLLLLYVLAAPKYWRDTAGELSARDADPPAWWSFSAGKWYGTRRSFVAATPLFVLALAAFALRDALGPRSPLADLLEWLLAVSFILSIALILLITLYNRPKALVPPHLRAEPGSRARKRARRAARRAA